MSKKIFDETNKLQIKTFESINKINSSISEIHTIGTMSLDELRANSDQIDDICRETKTIDDKLNSTNKLQKKFDIWNGNYLKLLFKKNKSKKLKVNTIENYTNNYLDNNKNYIKEKEIINKKIINFDNPNILDIKIKEYGKNNIDENTKSMLNQINSNNKKIDNSIGEIQDSLDKLLDISNLIGDEIKHQNLKLNQLDNDVKNIGVKQNDINIHLKKQLKKN